MAAQNITPSRKNSGSVFDLEERSVAVIKRSHTWYQTAGAPGLHKAAIQRYPAELEGQKLSASTLNVHLSAVRKLAAEAARALKTGGRLGFL